MDIKDVMKSIRENYACDADYVVIHILADGSGEITGKPEGFANSDHVLDEFSTIEELEELLDDESG